MLSLLPIVDVGRRSTHYWDSSRARSRLLVDLGHAGTFGRTRAHLARVGVPLGEIRYGLGTHYHEEVGFSCTWGIVLEMNSMADLIQQFLVAIFHFFRPFPSFCACDT